VKDKCVQVLIGTLFAQVCAMKTFSNRYCNGFCLGKKQLNCTRVEHNPNFLPQWQRKIIQELCQQEQSEMCNLEQLHEIKNAAHDLKASKLRERLRRNGMMTILESRNSATKWNNNNTPLTTSLPGMPSCFHCYKQHCPIRTITAIALPTSPTKDWVLSSRLFRKIISLPTKFTSNRWKKGSLFMGSHRVTVTAK